MDEFAGTPADSGDPLPPALARALAVPLARGRGMPACARAGAPDHSGGWLLLTGVQRVSPDRREALVGVGIRYAGSPDVPGSGRAEDWTYRVVRAGGRWRVVGMVGRRRST